MLGSIVVRFFTVSKNHYHVRCLRLPRPCRLHVFDSRPRPEPYHADCSLISPIDIHVLEGSRRSPSSQDCRATRFDAGPQTVVRIDFAKYSQCGLIFFKTRQRWFLCGTVVIPMGGSFIGFVGPGGIRAAGHRLSRGLRRVICYKEGAQQDTYKFEQEYDDTDSQKKFLMFANLELLTNNQCASTQRGSCEYHCPSRRSF